MLRRFAVARALDAERGREAMRGLAEMPLTRHPQRILLERIGQPQPT